MSITPEDRRSVRPELARKATHEIPEAHERDLWDWAVAQIAHQKDKPVSPLSRVRSPVEHYVDQVVLSANQVRVAEEFRQKLPAVRVSEGPDAGLNTYLKLAEGLSQLDPGSRSYAHCAVGAACRPEWLGHEWR